MKTIAIVLIAAVLLYLYLICPNLDKERKGKMLPFEQVYITHRGLFNNRDIPENSLKAFKGTVKNGYGTELDVQLTIDGKLVVFHDASLKRMCGVDRKLTDCTFAELEQYPLLDTEERIPLFEDVLDLLKEDTPLIVEIKPEGDCIRTCEEAVQMLKRYRRTYTMESFNPMVIRYLRRKHPEIIRGQLAYNMFSDKESEASPFIKLLCSNYLMNCLARPDYCAYDICSRSLSFTLISKMFKGECVAWTVKSEEDMSYARKHYQQYIFDSFIPKQQGERK